MRAELAGKMDPESTVGTERLEDSLTDAVASALLYADPTTVLGPLIRAMFPAATEDLTDQAAEAATIELWPRFVTGTEPDITVTVGGWLLIVEAKYMSGFGSGTVKDPTPQLVREWRDGRGEAQAKGLKGPLLTAVTKDPLRPVDVDDARSTLKAEVAAMGKLDVNDVIRWTSWRSVAQQLRGVRHGLAPQDGRLITDVLRIMDNRGVASMFTGIDPHDMAELSTAHEAATDRVTPAIAQLADELESQLERDDIVWGSANNGVWRWGNSNSRHQPTAWPMDHITLPWWPRTWSERVGSPQAALICQIDFAAAAIHVGYCQWTGSREAAADRWATRAGDLADALGSLPAGVSVAIDDRWSDRSNARAAEEVDAAWLEHGLRSHRTLWITRSHDVATLTSARAISDLIVETRNWIDDRPIILDLLRVANLVEGEPISA